MHLTQDPTPDQLMDMAEGARLSSLAPEMEAFVEKMMLQVQQRMFTAIATNKLTPELAVQGWHEIHAAYRLLQKYKQTIKVGQSTGAELMKEQTNGITS